MVVRWSKIKSMMKFYPYLYTPRRFLESTVAMGFATELLSNSNRWKKANKTMITLQRVIILNNKYMMT
jgi:hypothetical protein